MNKPITIIIIFLVSIYISTYIFLSRYNEYRYGNYWIFEKMDKVLFILYRPLIEVDYKINSYKHLRAISKEREIYRAVGRFSLFFDKCTEETALAEAGKSNPERIKEMKRMIFLVSHFNSILDKKTDSMEQEFKDKLEEMSPKKEEKFGK